jgi:hypothetical protein
MVILGILASLDPVRPVVFVLVLSTRRQNALAFLVGWAFALSLLFVVAFLSLGGDATRPPGSGQRIWASALELIIGVALLGVASRRWSRRHEERRRNIVPKAVLRRLDDLDRRKAGVLGVLIQPRALTVAAALVVARDRSGTLSLLIGFAVFAAVSTAAMLGILIYDTRHHEESRSRLSGVVELLERESARLITIGAAVGGGYLVVDALFHLLVR